MAIELEIIETRGLQRVAALQLPPVKVHKVSAAGSFNLNDLSTGCLIRSRGDAVHVRLNLQSDNTQAAAANDKSIRMAAGGDELGFVLEDTEAAYKLDIRAA